VDAARIREAFLEYFERAGHRRVPSASLVPSSYDPSVLLTTAGMQPFKPYFRGEEDPPAPRLTSCQKCFRTTDIENVGSTARHLTFFEMLGNFSIGEYFKDGAIAYAWEFTTTTLGFEPERIWISVMGGDEELGLGPDEEAIEQWRAVGVSDERIVRLGREDNFWQAGPTGPSGPCSELYLDRGSDFGSDADRPGDDTERFLEFWNLVFMQYELHEDGSLTDLPQRNIDTGLGLDRVAALSQGVPSVFETDQFRPVVALGEELSGRSYGGDEEATRALRILADHGRAMTFLMADGVVPSNEERGYILRRVMRRAIQQGRVLGLSEPFLVPLCDRVIETLAGAYPELASERGAIARWAGAEEEGFRRTLEQGERVLGEVVANARAAGTSWVDPEDAFRLHDTYGFPYELTKEMLAAEGLEVDDHGFAELMDAARARSRAGGARATAVPGGGPSRDEVLRFARAAGAESRFVGYESIEADTVIAALESADGLYLAKLADSPFYAEGGGQVSDSGRVETDSAAASVADVYRLGDDQAVALVPERGELAAGAPAHAAVDRSTRLATMANHTATHLLHAALREMLGTHVRQAGSYVGPDKLRFDFTHGARLSASEVEGLEARVNEWIADSRPVHAVTTTRPEAEALGALALFGEKYGDWVRMVEVENVSRELCGGTHVESTAEVGLFHIVTETSSAANVRRIEAVTGREGMATFRTRTRELRAVAERLKVPESEVGAAVERLAERVRELSKRGREAGQESAREAADALVAGAAEIGGIRVVADVVEAVDAPALLQLSDRVRQALGDAAVVLGSAIEDRAQLVANFGDAAVERGLDAAEVVREAADLVGGGGGGRSTMAQAGGRDPSRLPEAVAAARVRIESELR
jgi:alanyl-tRNA synthetase